MASECYSKVRPQDFTPRAFTLETKLVAETFDSNERNLEPTSPERSDVGDGVAQGSPDVDDHAALELSKSLKSDLVDKKNVLQRFLEYIKPYAELWSIILVIAAVFGIQLRLPFDFVYYCLGGSIIVASFVLVKKNIAVKRWSLSEPVKLVTSIMLSVIGLTVMSRPEWALIKHILPHQSTNVLDLAAMREQIVRRSILLQNPLLSDAAKKRTAYVSEGTILAAFEHQVGVIPVNIDIKLIRSQLQSELEHSVEGHVLVRVLDRSDPPYKIRIYGLLFSAERPFQDTMHSSVIGSPCNIDNKLPCTVFAEEQGTTIIQWWKDGATEIGGSYIDRLITPESTVGPETWEYLETRTWKRGFLILYVGDILTSFESNADAVWLHAVRVDESAKTETTKLKLWKEDVPEVNGSRSLIPVTNATEVWLVGDKLTTVQFQDNSSKLLFECNACAHVVLQTIAIWNREEGRFSMGSSQYLSSGYTALLRFVANGGDSESSSHALVLDARAKKCSADAPSHDEQSTQDFIQVACNRHDGLRNIYGVTTRRVGSDWRVTRVSSIVSDKVELSPTELQQIFGRHRR